MSKEEVEENIRLLKSPDLDKVEDAIRDLGRSEDRAVIPLLMDMLSREKDPNIRNALALSLGDLRANEAVSMLMSLAKDPENVNRRGSFVYALMSLDCKEYFLDFVKMICDGNYEVYHHAFEIIESQIDDVSFHDKLEAIKILENQKQIELTKPPSKHPKYDRINFINDALELLSE